MTEEPVRDEFDHLKVRDVRQFVIGVGFVFAIATCDAMLKNVVKKTIVPGFHAPAFLLFVRAGYRILTFPAFLICQCLYEHGKAALVKNCSPRPLKAIVK